MKEESNVCSVAEKAAQNITQKVIAQLQEMTATLSGDDSELKTTWEEICAQVQFEESFDWEIYDETVRSIISGYVEELPENEKKAIWLQTEVGIDWDLDEPEDRKPCHISDDEIVDYLAQNYVYTAAGDWSNEHIQAYIERSTQEDWED